jgi:hypothetical protein
VPTGAVPSVAVRDGLVLSVGARRDLSLWIPPRGTPQPLGVAGRIVSVAQDLLVVALDCPQFAECAHVVVDTRRRTIARLGLAPEYRPLSQPVLSQDGLWLALMVDPDRSNGKPEAALAYGAVLGRGDDLALVPGSRYLTGSDPPQGAGVVAPAWSLDGGLFGYAAGSAGLYRFQPGATAPRRLDISLPGPITRIVAG